MDAHDKSKELLALIIRLAQQYLNLPVDETSEAIQHSLEEMGRFVEADRAYIFSYDMQALTCSNTFEWCAPGVDPEIDNLQNVDMNLMPDWLEAHSQGKEMYIPNVQELPQDTGTYEILNSQGIKSVMGIPMMRNKELVGFVGFDSVKHYRHYSEQERSLLQLYAEMLVNIELRKAATDRIYFERDRAEKANREKSLFLANMSHEIRTPLNGIQGFTELLADTQLNSRQNEYVSVIERSSNLLLGIVNDILDLSKIEAGKINLHLKPVSLRDVTGHVASMLAERAKTKGLNLNIDCCESIQDQVITDETRLSQVLVNLVTNAIKYTDHGEVTLKVSQAPTRHTGCESHCTLRFDVTDTGIGITEDELSQIFTPFHQLHKERIEGDSGAGLGLAISQRIVQAMGGAIEVSSAPGSGAHFYFSLTFEKAPSDQSAPIVEEQSLQQFNYPDWSGKRILIAEDVQVNQRLLTHFLQPTSCTFVFANDGEEAVELALSHEFDLIIMDIQLPHIDGFKASEKILRQQPQAVIVAFSAAVDSEDIAKFRQFGMQGYIPKPVTRESFFQQLNGVLRRK